MDMNQNDILDRELEVLEFKVRIKECIGWWEKKRLFYNIFLAIIQLLIPIVLSGFISFFGHVTYIVLSCLFLFGANVFYSLDWGIEVLSIYYELNLNKLLVSVRPISLVLGFLFSGFITVWMYLDAIGFFGY